MRRVRRAERAVGQVAAVIEQQRGGTPVGGATASRWVAEAWQRAQRWLGPSLRGRRHVGREQSHLGPIVLVQQPQLAAGPGDQKRCGLQHRDPAELQAVELQQQSCVGAVEQRGVGCRSRACVGYHVTQELGALHGEHGATLDAGVAAP